MKWILSILLLISIGAIGQEDSTKYIWYRFQYGQRMPRGWWDSTAQLPYRDTTYTPARPGAIVMRPQDKQFYKWNGTLWSILSGSGTSYAGPFNAPATGDTLVNSDKEVKRLNPGYGILHSLTGTNITQRVDTSSANGLVTKSMLRDTSAALRAAIMAARPADSLQYFYVTRYGAVADSSTDNSAAFQAAVNAAKAAGGGVVFIPRGKWGLTSTVTVDTSNIIIRGSGAATQLWANTDYGDVLRFRPNTVPAPHANYFHDVGVYDLSIQSAVDRTSGYAIYTNYTHSATVANCVIGFMRTAHRDVITPFYMGVGFENESNAVLMNTQVYAWKKGVVFTGTAIGASFRNTNNFDGLITANCFIIGDTTKWHESDSTYGVHVGGGVGGVQIEQCNISFYTNGIRVDKQLNNVPNAQFFIGHAFAADNCGAAGVHVGNNGVGEQFQVTGGWAAANGNAADAVIKDAIYIDPTGNNNLQTVIAGGTFRYNLVGSGINVGGGHVTITGAQFHDNDASDIVLGANVQSATISGNTLTSGITNNSSVLPNFIGSGTTANPNQITATSNASVTGLSFGNMSTGTSSGASLGVFNNNGPSSSFFNLSITGSNHAGYGALASNTAYLYTPGASKMVFMIDNPTGPLVFAPGGNAEKIRMTPNGRLGIGTTTPSGSFHASGSDATSAISATLQNTSNNSAVTTAYMALNNTSNTASYGISSSTYNANAFIGANAGFLYNDAPGGLAVALANATANFRISTNSIERFRISDTGALAVRFSYSTNLGSTYTRYSLVDKNYVDSAVAAGGGGATTIYTGDGTLAGDREVTGSDNDLTFLTLDQLRFNMNTLVLSKNDGTRPFTASIAGSGNILKLAYTPTAGSYSKGDGLQIDSNNNVSIGAASAMTTAPLYATGNSFIANGIQNNGGLFLRLSNVNGSLTLGLTQHVILVDATSGNITLTLPAASTAQGSGMGIQYLIKRMDNSGNTITVQRSGSDTIDGGTSFTLTAQYETKTVIAVSNIAWAIF